MKDILGVHEDYEMKMFVRKGTMADIASVEKLWQSLVGTPGCMWDEEYPAASDARRDVEEGALYVLCLADENADKEETERIIGAMAAGDDDELWSLSCWDRGIHRRCGCARLGIAADFQGRGLAETLFSYVEQDVIQRGFDGIGFLVSPYNPAALAVYHKMNYKKVGETWRYEQDFYCYEKKLLEESI